MLESPLHRPSMHMIADRPKQRLSTQNRMDGQSPRKKIKTNGVGAKVLVESGWRTDYASPRILTLAHHKKYHGNFPGDGSWLDLPTIPRWQPRSTLRLHTPGHYASPTDQSLLPLKPSTLEAEEQRCHYCQLKQFSKYIQYPVTITNTIDTSTIDPSFVFIQECLETPGVEYAADEFRSGCECDDGDANACCLRGCGCQDDAGLVDGVAYDEEACLREEFLMTGPPIYECHDECACDRWCPNKVIQRGRQIPLDIFRTEGRGWGVRSNVDIMRGQFIDKYVGEIITNATANARRAEAQSAKRKDVYLFALDKFNDKASHDPRLACEPYEIDGENASGPTRFINHSCDPNLRIVARVADYCEKDLHELAFFALDDIEAGTELTFDYVDGKPGDLDSVDKEDMTVCLCGAGNCRGFLW